MKNGDQPITATTFRQTGDHTIRVATDKDLREGLYLTTYSGLTKREAIAMHALQGIIADPHHSLTRELAANAATRFADALLAELEKQPQL